MASSCSLGTINAKILPLDCGRRRVNGILRINSSRTLAARKSLENSGLRIISRRSWKVLNPCSATSLETLAVVSSEVDGEEAKSSGSTSELIPNFDEVASLLTTICDTTSIAEVELKLSGFRLHVTRNPDAKVSTQPPPSAETASSYTVVEGPDLNGSVSAPSLAITKLETSTKNIRTFVDRAADEGLVLIKSPKVGFFRRSRTIKGKRAPPPCKEKQTVKEGQVVCYIDQLGGELPIESDVSGEVIKILREDGDPVGYNDPLIAILPSFPGIKKLQ